MPDLILQSPPASSSQGNAESDPLHWRGKSVIETLFLLVVAALFFALKVLDLRAYRVDSDEPQHLHVVWAWANGLLQYRDVFDNHTPLFQMLCAPFFAMIHERPDIEIPMRLLMFPICAATLWITARIGAQLVGKRAGLWAALFTLAMPGFFFTSEEFRTDDLWMVMWMLCVLFALQRPFTPMAALRLGLAIGASFGTSMKTTLLLLSLVAGGLGTLLLYWKSFRLPAASWLVSRATALIAGGLIIPVALVIFFASHGALKEFYYCTVQHNMLSGMGTMKHPLSHILRFIVHLGLALWAGGYLLRRFNSRPQMGSLVFLFLTATALFAFVFNIWPVVTAQDYLPLYPLLGILLVALLWELPWKLAAPLGATAIVGGMAFIVYVHPPWQDQTSDSFRIRAAALRLLNPGEYIMDGKGETVYRPRPFYYALELLTLKRMYMGLIQDNIPERMIATRTCVAKLTRLHGKDQEFVKQNYIDIGFKLYVPGKLFPQPQPGQPISFNTVIPTQYDVVQPTGSFHGTIDGQPYHPGMELPGRSTYARRQPADGFRRRGVEPGD
ncbi:MAG: glycosyltransferase family 39 protein [Chthoniobacteraceae bacterium]